MPHPLLALLFAVTALACDAQSDDVADGSVVLAFDTARVQIRTQRDSFTLTVEVARSAEQKSLGLMERRSMPDSVGMLFLYSEQQPASAGFWMFRTRISLDIAFMDSAGVIVATRRMEPCDAQLAAGCPTYAPGAPYFSALEVNAGYFERRGIGVGSQIRVISAPRPNP